jgi:WD40 repeat protein/serine/threonine protein kinase
MPVDPKRVQAVFLAAAEQISPADRAALVARECGEDADLRRRVEVLLQAHDQPQSFLNVPAAEIAATSHAVAPSIGTLIGPYKLIEHIGDGGMGTVWMAQQTEPVKRLVAVKLIKAGMDTSQVIARFEAERQALALMDHANIARVLDAGTTDAGRPYFVMDLVRGVPITRYCDEHHLTPRQRLELFIPVCQAIQHAHQKGIIHRDLKPSNVLVALYDGKPVPKVIDFGVAKATGQTLTDKTLVTGFGAIVGTLEYMSPEQAEINQLDIDTRSDIYSLGVLLYELLTGSPPFSRKELEKAGMLEMLRVIREEEPTKPSTKLSTAEGLPTLAANRGTEPAKLTKLVRGELDWIVMKALEKDRNRRYETANGFAMDVQRYLADEPVLACPPSMGYRFGKFARRHKGPVLAVSVVSMALISGIVGTTLAMLRAQTAEDFAVAESRAKEKALQQKGAALRQVREEQKRTVEAHQRTQAALLESRREAARLAFEQAYNECSQQNIDRGFVAMAYCLAKARQAEMPELEESIRRHLAGWARSHHPWRTAFPHDGGTMATGAPVNLLAGRQEMAVAFGPEGKTIVVASATSVRSWDLEKGKLLSHFKPQGKSVAISADGAMVATAEPGKFVRLWAVATGQQVRSPFIHPADVDAVAFRPDGRAIVTTCDDQTLRLWDTQTGKIMTPAFKQPAPAMMVAFSPDSNLIVTAVDKFKTGPDGLHTLKAGARKWDPATGDAIGPLVTPPDRNLHQEQIYCLAFSLDGELVATVGMATRAPVRRSPTFAQVWEVATGKPVGPPLRCPSAVKCAALAFSPDGKCLLAAAGKEVYVWEIDSGRELAPPLQHRENVLALAFSPDGSTILSSGEGSAYLWQLDTVRNAFADLRDEDILCGVFSPDGHTILTGGHDGAARFWDAATGKPKGITAYHPPQIRTVAYSPDGSTFVTADYYTVRQWETKTGKLLGKPMTLDKGLIPAVSFSHDGKTIITGSMDGTIRLWEAARGQPLGQPRRDHSSSTTLAVSADGNMIATGGADKTARLWDALSGKALSLPLLHEAEVRGVSLSRNGRFLATESVFHVVRLWDVTSGHLVGQPLHNVGLAPVSCDGKTIAGLWETATGKAIGPRVSGFPWSGVVWSRDEQKLVVANRLGTAHVWNISPVEGEPARIILWAQVVTGKEIDDQGLVCDLDFETRRQRRRELDHMGGPPWP